MSTIFGTILFQLRITPFYKKVEPEEEIFDFKR